MRSSAPALAGFTALGLFWGAWASLLPAVQRATDASKAELGLALLFATVGSLPAMLVAGRLVDRYGARVAGLAAAAFAAATLLPGLATSVPALAAALVAAGAGSGALDVAINARVARAEDASGRRIMPFAHGLYSVGVVAGAVGAGVARGAGAGREAVLAAVAVALAAVAVANGRGREPAAGAAPSLSLERALVAIGVVGAVAFLVEGSLESWSALFLDRVHHASPAAAGFGPGTFAAAMALGRFAGQGLGRLDDRTLLAGGAATAIAGCTLVSASPSLAVALAGFALGGAGISLAAPVLFGAAGRGRANAGSAVATVTSLGYVGLLVGPPLFGGTAEAVGLRAAFLFAAGAAAVVVAAAPRLRL